MSNHNYSQYSNKNNNRKVEVDANVSNVNRKVEVDANVSNNPNNKPKHEPKQKPVVTEQPKIEPEVLKPIPEVKPVQETPVVNLVKETVETVALPETVEGVVVNCGKLNVREAPSIDADVVYVLDVQSELIIDVAKSTKEWFSICTATGVEGYCMRKFVEAHM